MTLFNSDVILATDQLKGETLSENPPLNIVAEIHSN